MGKIIAITSMKGGVGKTTTCLNLGVSLAKMGKKVLLVDTDPQGALAVASNLKKITGKGLVQMLRNELREEDILIQAGNRSLFLVGTGVETLDDLFALEKESNSGRLGMAVKGLAMGFDYILLDTRTGVHTSLQQLLTHADSFLLPCPCQADTIRTLPLFLKLIRRVQSEHNPQLKLEGVLLTLDNNTPQANVIRQEINKAFPPEIFFHTRIPFLPSLELAALHALPVALLKNAPIINEAFDALARELDARQPNTRTETP